MNSKRTPSSPESPSAEVSTSVSAAASTSAPISTSIRSKRQRISSSDADHSPAIAPADEPMDTGLFPVAASNDDPIGIESIENEVELLQIEMDSDYEEEAEDTVIQNQSHEEQDQIRDTIMQNARETFQRELYTLDPIVATQNPRLALISIVNQRRSSNGKPTFPAGHTAWNLLTYDMVQALFNAVANPLTFDPTEHLNVFVQPEFSQVPQGQSVFYLRSFSCQNSNMKTIINQYHSEFPSDFAWSTIMLEQLQTISDDASVTLSYIGTTIGSSVRRLAYDRSFRNFARFGNLCFLFNTLRWRVFELRDLFVPTTDLDIVTNELRNAIESILISIFGYLSLNSSYGGSFVEYAPSPEISEIVRNEHVAQTFAVPSSTPLTSLINAHFQSIQNLYKEAGAPEASRAYFDAITRAASTSQINGFVPMVMIGKDTTSRSLRLGLSFGDPRCGPAPALFDAMQSTLNTLLPEGNVTPSIPFVDLHDFSTSHVPVIANLHLCKYLSIVRPLVVHSMSSLVTNVFHDSKLVDGLNTQNPDFDSIWSFYPASLEELTQFVNVDNLEHSSIANGLFSGLLGNIFLASYGPNPSDICLVFPTLDPGSVVKDPQVEKQKLETFFLSLLAIRNLRQFVLNKLLSDPLPNDALALRLWLLGIRNEFLTTCSTTMERLVGVRQELKDILSYLLGHRMAGASRGGGYERALYSSSVKRLTALGEPNSEIRQQQLEQILTKQRRAVQEYRTLLYLPCPITVQDVESPEYKNWFTSRRAGIFLAQAARITGLNHYEALSEADKAEYWVKRGVINEARTRGIYAEINPVKALADLANPSILTSRVSGAFIWYITCIVCNEAFLGDRNTSHECMGVMRSSKASGFQYARMLYPHDLLSREGLRQVDILQWDDWIQEDAARILRREAPQLGNIGALPEDGTLDLVYCRTGGHLQDEVEKYLFTMAVDRLIATWGHGNFRPPNYLQSDEWLATNSASLNSVATSMSVPSPDPLCELVCGETPPCNFYTVNTERNLGRNRNRRQHQHRVADAGGTSTVVRRLCVIRTQAFEFQELPLDLRRRLWLRYQQEDRRFVNGGRSYNPLFWRAPRNV